MASDVQLLQSRHHGTEIRPQVFRNLVVPRGLKSAGFHGFQSIQTVTLSSRRKFCVRGEGVQGVLTLFCGGVAQTSRGDRVVELKEQLGVEEVAGEGQEGKVKEEGEIESKRTCRAMRCAVSSSGVKQCALCASSTHDVHHAVVGVNVVIGVLVVHCELLVVRVVPLVVCDDAVVRRALVHIAVALGFVFVVAIFSKNFAVLEVYCLHPPSVTVNCCWLLPNFEL